MTKHCINIDDTQYMYICESAHNHRQSVAAWIREAAEERLDRELAEKCAEVTP